MCVQSCLHLNFLAPFFSVSQVLLLVPFAHLHLHRSHWLPQMYLPVCIVSVCTLGVHACEGGRYPEEGARYPLYHFCSFLPKLGTHSWLGWKSASHTTIQCPPTPRSWGYRPLWDLNSGPRDYRARTPNLLPISPAPCNVSLRTVVTESSPPDLCLRSLLVFFAPFQPTSRRYPWASLSPFSCSP